MTYRFKVMNVRSLLIVAVGLSSLLTLAGCSALKPLMPTSSVDTVVPDNGAEIFADHWTPLPTCLSFKPLTSVKAGADLRADLFESIKGHLLAKGYKIVDTDKPCDYKMEGDITQRDKGFFGVFSRSTLGAELKLSRLLSGQRLWQTTQMVDFSDGAVPFSLVGISSAIYKASDSLSRDKELMAVDNLARKLTSSLPYIPESQALRGSDQLSKWPEGLDKWLQSQPAIDRPQLLKATLKNDALTAQDAEMAYVRLCQLESDPANWRQWAQFRLSTGDQEGAVSLLSKGLQSHSADSESYFLKGRILASLSRFQEADDALVQAIAINADKSLFYEALAYVNASRGNYERALAAYKKILKISPGEPFAHKNLAELSLKLGDADAGIQYFETASRLYADGGHHEKVLEIKNALAQHIATSGDATGLARQAVNRISADLKRAVAP